MSCLGWLVIQRFLFNLARRRRNYDPAADPNNGPISHNYKLIAWPASRTALGFTPYFFNFNFSLDESFLHFFGLIFINQDNAKLWKMIHLISSLTFYWRHKTLPAVQDCLTHEMLAAVGWPAVRCIHYTRLCWAGEPGLQAAVQQGVLHPGQPGQRGGHQAARPEQGSQAAVTAQQAAPVFDS